MKQESGQSGWVSPLSSPSFITQNLDLSGHSETTSQPTGNTSLRAFHLFFFFFASLSKDKLQLPFSSDSFKWTSEPSPAISRQQIASFAAITMHPG